MSEQPDELQANYKIYVACLAAYNAGKLYGRWIDATQEADEIQEEVAAMLAESPEPGAEEWAIHDFDMGGIELSESTSFSTVSELAQALEEHGEAFGLFWNYMGYTDGQVRDATQAFDEAYCGEWESERAYAQDTLEECWEIPDYLQYYIDWDSVARDIFINDCWFEDGHVFRHV